MMKIEARHSLRSEYTHVQSYVSKRSIVNTGISQPSQQNRAWNFRHARAHRHNSDQIKGANLKPLSTIIP